ncbi:hypothetical protein Acr_20g0005000 [Actinidia rufa]|uniref:Uncharacterized protein n=1 Tax=Actinidia rufa TaxID=165716 RepID=A0A7J0GD77_9ERIC|nr:hypothetical protein Acr_20g0005000 [Actinidia rufa]
MPRVLQTTTRQAALLSRDRLGAARVRREWPNTCYGDKSTLDRALHQALLENDRHGKAMKKWTGVDESTRWRSACPSLRSPSQTTVEALGLGSSSDTPVSDLEGRLTAAGSHDPT